MLCRHVFYTHTLLCCCTDGLLSLPHTHTTNTAFLVMPAAYTALVGKPLWDLTPAGQADFALWSEILEVFVTFGIVGSVAARWVVCL